MGQNRAKVDTVRWYLSLNANFCKSTNPGVKTDSVVTFRSEVFNSINTHELDYQFDVEYNQIVLQIEEFQRSGSSWVVDQFQFLDLGACFFILNIYTF